MDVSMSDVDETYAQIESLSSAINSNDPAIQLSTTTKIRKLLTNENKLPEHIVIDAVIVKRLVEFLRYNNPELQFESCWALTNLAIKSSEHTRCIIERGAIPSLKDLLVSQHENVREQAIWALGTIAGDSPQCRDFVLLHGVFQPLLHNLLESKLTLLRNAAWTISNLCRGKPQPHWDMVSCALPTLCFLVFVSDEEVLVDACWALSYLSDGPNDRIQHIIECGVVRRVVELLLHSSFTVQTPALRIISNIVTGDDTQTQVVINLGVLPCLLSLLSSPRKSIRKDACWALSNIMAGNKTQVQAVIDAQIIPKLISLLQTDEFDIKKEAAWALSNATSSGSPEQIRYLVHCNVITPLCSLLETDPRIILVSLEALGNILKVGEKDCINDNGINEYAMAIEECEGLDKIEALQNDPNNEIYEKAVSILEEYFSSTEKI